MLYIHPEQCIDCQACVPECPRDAIYHEDKLPYEWVPFRDLNATMARQCTTIERRPSAWLPERSPQLSSRHFPNLTGTGGGTFCDFEPKRGSYDDGEAN
jgi:ferredoxin